MAIRIGTKKKIKDGVRFREIIKITGVAEKDQLPPEYLELNQCIFAISSGVEIHNHGSTTVIKEGDVFAEGVFLILLDIIQNAGNNLYRLNKGLPINESWKGRETFEV